MLAIKFAHDCYFYLGKGEEMRDSIARVLPNWNSSIPLYSYLYGMISFGLGESNYFQEAEKMALKGLELNRFDGWSTHSFAHIKEYRNETKEGIEFLNTNEQDWGKCNMISPHLYWHLCLYYIEEEDFEKVVEINREKIWKKAIKTGSIYDLVDAVSLITRLKIQGYKDDFKEEMQELFTICKDKANDHGFLFNDLHTLLVIGANDDQKLLNEYSNSFNHYVNYDTKDYLRNINKEVGPAINEALISYQKGQFENVIENLSGTKYLWKGFGGSNAQRDMLHQILVESLLKTKKKEYINLTKGLINERLCMKPNSKINQRFLKRMDYI